MVKVAIIDDGVGQGVYGDFDLADNIEITEQLEVLDGNDRYIFNRSHGTICAAIIKKYFNDAIISSVKILNYESHKSTKNQLIKAVEWCILNNIDVINMSLGTIDYRDFDEVKNIVDTAFEKGIIIVAACNNKNIYTCPASFNNVIGVKSTKARVLKEGEYIFNIYSIDGIEITACAEHRLLKNGVKREVTASVNSYAAPMITAEICKIKRRFPTLNFSGIKKNLYKNSCNYSKNINKVNNYINIDWMNNGVLLNLDNKELKISSKYKIDEISSIKDLNLNKYNTLIVLDSIIKEHEINRSILEHLNKYNKNIIAIDEKHEDCESNMKLISRCNNIWHPLLMEHFYESCLQTKKIDIPIIVFYNYESDKENMFMELVGNFNDKFRDNGYFSIGVSLSSIGILNGFIYMSNSANEEMKKIRHKIECIYAIYYCDVIVLEVKVDTKDIDYIKEFNKYINPDISVFNSIKLVENIKDLDSNEKYMILDKRELTNFSNLRFKIFQYNELDLLYKEIVKNLL
ncbi:S8 family serine peptidase [Clostridium sporogenes]|uniref:S8 family serine peptidase n=1 Tax=Clostridium sporogenes TaxID=1509 RepID=UPI00223885F6|nr:S8 family serine peptidase [Clostridium sporogenes]MCW6060210.1 S8 family serine peptidase [Clostridium sporogenes]MCW6068146.1 S8 family serine peptidase [Clostridium sporogenes]